MHCQWVLWCNTNQQRKAAKLLSRVTEALGCVPRDVGYQYDVDIPGFRATFTTTLQAASRDSCVVEAITFCEKLGANWVIEGGIRERTSFFSQQMKITGVVACECYLRPTECGSETASEQFSNSG